MNTRKSRGGTAGTLIGLLAIIVGVGILFYLLSGSVQSYTKSVKPAETLEQKQEQAAQQAQDIVGRTGQATTPVPTPANPPPARQSEDIITPGIVGVAPPMTDSPAPRIAKPKIPTSIRSSIDQLEQP